LITCNFYLPNLVLNNLKDVVGGMRHVQIFLQIFLVDHRVKLGIVNEVDVLLLSPFGFGTGVVSSPLDARLKFVKVYHSVLKYNINFAVKFMRSLRLRLRLYPELIYEGRIRLHIADEI